MPPAKRIELLLQTALTERHLRRALLAEVVDELVGSGQYPEAAQAGHALLTQLATGIDGREYVRRVQHMIALIGQSPSERDGMTAIPIGDARPRANASRATGEG